MPFIACPNSPQNDVILAAVSSLYPAIINKLERQGIESVSVVPYDGIDFPCRTHADMRCHPLGGNKIVIARGDTQLKKQLQSNGFEVIESNASLNEKYPGDILLNAARIGNFLLAHPTGLDLVIKRYCLDKNIEIIPVKQGYTKCSTVVVDTYSVITADTSIASIAAQAGLDVLKIEPGFVQLPGYTYGFIGGASGMIGAQKLAFTGSLEMHPDCSRIKSFLRKKNIEWLCLTNQPMLDIGGIVPLKIK